MKKHGAVIISITLSCIIYAQHLPGKLVVVTAGYGKHGSGDMNGIVFGAEYARYSSRSISLNYYFRGSINNGKDIVMINNGFTGPGQDASIRFTTAGLQAGINARYSFIRTKRNEVLISLGGFGRYQSASNGSDRYSLYYPATTGVPNVLVEYNNRTPQQTYAVGGLLQLQYNFTFNKNIVMGLAPGFQTDTNGDVLLQAVMVAGIRLR